MLTLTKFSDTLVALPDGYDARHTAVAGHAALADSTCTSSRP